MEDSSFPIIHIVWDAILTFFVGIFFYFRKRDDLSLDALWEKKADKESVGLLRSDIKELKDLLMEELLRKRNDHLGI